MFKLAFFVPHADKEKVKQAVFAAGGGRIGNYDSCCFETQGTGQFRPLTGAQPALGEVGALEQVGETKVELVCEAARIDAVIRALKAAHPYEEPAYEVWRLEDF